MKRCPQCEFSFDDEESCCDFDGSELLPILNNLRPAPSSSRLGRILRSPIPLGTLGLSAVILSALVVGYYDAASQASSSEPVTPLSANEQAASLPAAPPMELPAATTIVRSHSGMNSARQAPTIRRAAPVRIVHRSRTVGRAKELAVSRKRLASNKTHRRQVTRLRGAGVAKRIVKQTQLRDANSQTLEPAETHHKSESKFTALLKQTARLLKTPFQF